MENFKNDDIDPSDRFTNVSEEQSQRYLDEMLSQKYFSNLFELNTHFMNYQNSSPYNPSVDASEHYCELDKIDSKVLNSSIGVDDDSSYTTKLVSLRAHKPEAEYKMLESSDGSDGYASIGNGYLSVKDGMLNSGKELYPAPIYEHEKLHNHGFDQIVL